MTDLSSFFFTHTASTEIYTLSLHDALPIWPPSRGGSRRPGRSLRLSRRSRRPDRKSTRLNSRHRCISYAVFCLKKKTENRTKHVIQERTRVRTSPLERTRYV